MKPRAREGAIVRELPDGELVVSTPDATRAVILNSMGSVVLDLSDGTRSIEQIVEFICANVAGAAPDVVAVDVGKLVTELIDAGVMEDAECGTGPSVS